MLGRLVRIRYNEKDQWWEIIDSFTRKVLYNEFFTEESARLFADKNGYVLEVS